MIDRLAYPQLQYRSTALSVFLWLALALVSCGPQVVLADTVIQISGGQERGTIEKSSKEGILIDGKPIMAGDIRYVLFSDEPRELRSIRDAVAKGNYAKAEQTLARLDMSKISGDLQEMDADFYRGYVVARRALQTGENQASAVKLMLAYVKSHPNSFHFFDAAEVLGELAMALGQDKEAVRYFGALSKSSSERIRTRGMSRLAEALLARGAYDEALKQYDAMLQAASDEDSRTTALLGKALCQAQLGSGADGVKTVEEIIAQTNPKKGEIMARAYNALGACYRADGKDNAAVLAYLHVDLLFSKHGVQHAESLYYLSSLWGKVGHADRAAQARETLQSKYGGSSWASKL